MKKNLFKRIITFAICSIMMMTTAVPAFAAESEQMPQETVKEGTVIAEYTLNATTTDGAITLDDYENDPVITTVSAWGEGYLHPSLSSYIGITKSFYVSTSSSATSGGVFLYLYNKNGKLVSDDWSMGVNDYASWKMTLPSSGTYTLKVVAMTDQDVRVAASWEG